MPSSDAILAGATTIANHWKSVAIVWHALLTAVAAVIFLGWRPSNRLAGYILSAPVLSVGAAAWAWDNPFNGMVFGALFVALILRARRLSIAPIHFSRPFLFIPGAALIAFGWSYPHFLEADHWTEYFYAAPLGLLPCPTLSFAIGVTLVFGLLDSAAWSRTLAVAGLTYGVVGVFFLGVELDYVLIAGALVLGTSIWISWARRRCVGDPEVSDSSAVRGGAPFTCVLRF